MGSRLKPGDKGFRPESFNPAIHKTPVGKSVSKDFAKAEGLKTDDSGVVLSDPNTPDKVTSSRIIQDKNIKIDVQESGLTTINRIDTGEQFIIFQQGAIAQARDIAIPEFDIEAQERIKKKVKEPSFFGDNPLARKVSLAPVDKSGLPISTNIKEGFFIGEPVKKPSPTIKELNIETSFRPDLKGQGTTIPIRVPKPKLDDLTFINVIPTVKGQGTTPLSKQVPKMIVPKANLNDLSFIAVKPDTKGQTTTKNLKTVPQELQPDLPILVSDSTLIEKFAYGQVQREKKISLFRDKLVSKIGAERDFTKNPFAPKEFGKALTRTALDIPIGLGTLVTRTPLFVTAPFTTQGRKAIVQAGKETPKALLQTFDPRTPEGVISIGLTLFGVKSVAKANIIKGATKKVSNQPIKGKTFFGFEKKVSTKKSPLKIKTNDFEITKPKAKVSEIITQLKPKKTVTIFSSKGRFGVEVGGVQRTTTVSKFAGKNVFTRTTTQVTGKSVSKIFFGDKLQRTVKKTIKPDIVFTEPKTIGKTKAIIENTDFASSLVQKLQTSKGISKVKGKRVPKGKLIRGLEQSFNVEEISPKTSLTISKGGVAIDIAKTKFKLSKKPQVKDPFILTKSKDTIFKQSPVIAGSKAMVKVKESFSIDFVKAPKKRSLIKQKISNVFSGFSKKKTLDPFSKQVKQNIKADILRREFILAEKQALKQTKPKGKKVKLKATTPKKSKNPFTSKQTTSEVTINIKDMALAQKDLVIFGDVIPTKASPLILPIDTQGIKPSLDLPKQKQIKDNLFNQPSGSKQPTSLDLFVDTTSIQSSGSKQPQSLDLFIDTTTKKQPRSKQAPALDLFLGETTIQQPETIIDPFQQQRPIQTKTPTKNIFGFTSIPPVKIKTPIAPPKPFFPGLNAKANLVDGFDVFVKVKGKDLKVNKKALTKIGAKNLGYDINDNTVSASFEPRPSKQKAKEQFFEIESDKARKFRKKDKRYIEKETYRIDTAGEFQGITVKGRLARQNKRGNPFM